MDKTEDFLEVSDLKKYFHVNKGQRKIPLKAVDGVGFRLARADVLGVVGESGCGKSTLGRTLLRLYSPTSGAISFLGIDLIKATERELRKLRSRMQMIFQDPYSSLNPRMTVGRMLRQILDTHGVKDNEEATDRCIATIRNVGLEPDHLNRFPHEFSGGQRQRVAIARALILNPVFIVADEPSSALDMSIQAQILNLLKSLQKEMSLSILFITHNLAVARFICRQIAVMYLGQFVEVGPSAELSVILSIHIREASSSYSPS